MSAQLQLPAVAGDESGLLMFGYFYTCLPACLPAWRLSEYLTPPFSTFCPRQGRWVTLRTGEC